MIPRRSMRSAGEKWRGRVIQPLKNRLTLILAKKSVRSCHSDQFEILVVWEGIVWIWAVIPVVWFLVWARNVHLDKTEDLTVLASSQLPPRPLFTGGHNGNTEAFLREYKWLHDLLERTYPGHEFFIVPKHMNIRPPGWERVYLEWDGHLIFKRPLRKSA